MVLLFSACLKKIEALNTEFRHHYYTIVELMDDEALEEEQVVLDDSDERVADFVERLQQLMLEPE